MVKPKHDEWTSMQGLTLSVGWNISKCDSKLIIPKLHKSPVSLSYTKFNTENNSKGYY